MRYLKTWLQNAGGMARLWFVFTCLWIGGGIASIPGSWANERARFESVADGRKFLSSLTVEELQILKVDEEHAKYRESAQLRGRGHALMLAVEGGAQLSLYLDNPKPVFDSIVQKHQDATPRLTAWRYISGSLSSWLWWLGVPIIIAIVYWTLRWIVRGFLPKKPG